MKSYETIGVQQDLDSNIIANIEEGKENLTGGLIKKKSKLSKQEQNYIEGNKDQENQDNNYMQNEEKQEKQLNVNNINIIDEANQANVNSDNIEEDKSKEWYIKYKQQQAKEKEENNVEKKP